MLVTEKRNGRNVEFSFSFQGVGVSLQGYQGLGVQSFRKIPRKAEGAPAGSLDLREGGGGRGGGVLSQTV